MTLFDLTSFWWNTGLCKCIILHTHQIFSSMWFFSCFLNWKFISKFLRNMEGIQRNMTIQLNTIWNSHAVFSIYALNVCPKEQRIWLVWLGNMRPNFHGPFVMFSCPVSFILCDWYSWFDIHGDLIELLMEEIIFKTDIFDQNKCFYYH